MRRMVLILTAALAMTALQSCTTLRDGAGTDRGLLESSLRVNDTILNEYEEYVKNDKSLDPDAKMARVFNLKAYRMLLRSRADEYNRLHPVGQ